MIVGKKKATVLDIIWHKYGVSHQLPAPTEDKENLLTVSRVIRLKPALCLLSDIYLL